MLWMLCISSAKKENRMADKLPPLKVSDLLAQIKAVLRESRMTAVEKCSDIRSIVAIAEAALATPRGET